MAEFNDNKRGDFNNALENLLSPEATGRPNYMGMSVEGLGALDNSVQAMQIADLVFKLGTDMGLLGEQTSRSKYLPLHSTANSMQEEPVVSCVRGLMVFSSTEITAVFVVGRVNRALSSV